jgi:dipeptidyl aminopeptidase/acylaminoacyl peptidase
VAPPAAGDARKIAGGPGESIFQPQWSPNNELYFVSDRTGWWNLYRQREGEIQPIIEMEAEFASPMWVFGLSTYAFEAPDKIIAAFNGKGVWHLAAIDAASRTLRRLETPFTVIGDVHAAHAGAGRTYFTAASTTEPFAVIQYDSGSGKTEILRRSTDLSFDKGYLSEPQSIEFPTEGGRTTFGFFYAPRNRDFVAPKNEKPPLLVMSHGGPTGATNNAFRLAVQYWTSRGIAVLDVNYGGSTGYGRAYRERLKGNWGIVDVDDCTNGARFLVAGVPAGPGQVANLYHSRPGGPEVAQVGNLFRSTGGLVDGNRLAIRGGSAGGYTTLAALAFRDVFKVGASYYGVSDLEALAKETHKFESRYLDGLIGPYPERRDLYIERSPIHAIDRLGCPIIFLQGLDDKIVPPNQAETMVEALRRKGLPVAYVAFEGEQHGFRQSQNIKRSLDAELYFYSRIFRFNTADEIEPVEIENLP